MLKESTLLFQIELKRKEIYKSALENGNNHAITITISQELDKLLNSLLQLQKFNIKGEMHDV
jgi:hypothetical protein